MVYDLLIKVDLQTFSSSQKPNILSNLLSLVFTKTGLIHSFYTMLITRTKALALCQIKVITCLLLPLFTKKFSFFWKCTSIRSFRTFKSTVRFVWLRQIDWVYKRYMPSVSSVKYSVIKSQNFRLLALTCPIFGSIRHIDIIFSPLNSRNSRLFSWSTMTIRV